MINYNYLSCTDYNGNTKEINFCSDTLPESANAGWTYLALHTDKNNSNLLHIRSVEHLQEDTLYYNVGKITIKPSVSISSPYLFTDTDTLICFTFLSKEPWPANNAKQFVNFKTWIEEQLHLNNHLGVEILPNTITLPVTGVMHCTKKNDGTTVQCVPLNFTFQDNDIRINFTAADAISDFAVFYNLNTLDNVGNMAYITIESYTVTNTVTK